MDDLIALVGSILCDDARKTTRKRPNHNLLNEEEQELLSVPRRNACKEYTACASRAHMTLTPAEP